MNGDHEYMDLQQLRYVVEVAENASFTRAAEKCFVTQSALSHQIAALERELGERLFVRSSRIVRATEVGEAFLGHARSALAAADRAKEAVMTATGAVAGPLRLGVIPTVTAVRVPRVLAAFRDAYPAVRVEMEMGNSDTLMRAISEDRLDVAILGLRDAVVPVGVAYRRLSSERLVAVLHQDHPLAGRKRLRLEDLEGAVFADFPRGTSGRAQSDVAFAAVGVERDVAYEVDSASLMLDLVAEGLASALLAPGVVDPARPGISTVTVVDGPRRIEYVAWEQESPRRVATAFLELLEATASAE